MLQDSHCCHSYVNAEGRQNCSATLCAMRPRNGTAYTAQNTAFGSQRLGNNSVLRRQQALPGQDVLLKVLLQFVIPSRSAASMRLIAILICRTPVATEGKKVMITETTQGRNASVKFLGKVAFPEEEGGKGAFDRAARSHARTT